MRDFLISLCREVLPARDLTGLVPAYVLKLLVMAWYAFAIFCIYEEHGLTGCIVSYRSSLHNLCLQT